MHQRLCGLFLAISLAAPAFAQQVTLSVRPAIANPQPGDRTTVCADIDGDVKNAAGWLLTFLYPGGWRVLASGSWPSYADGAFHPDPFISDSLISASFASVLGGIGEDPTANALTVGIVGTTGRDGPGELGCFDLVAGEDARADGVSLRLEANDPDGHPLAVTARGITLAGGPFPPPDSPAPATGRVVTICADDDANVRSAESWKLDFVVPYGWIRPDHSTFQLGDLLLKGSASIYGNLSRYGNPSHYTFDLISQDGADGPGTVGCFDLLETTDSRYGEVVLNAEVKNDRVEDLKVTTKSGTIDGVGSRVDLVILGDPNAPPPPNPWDCPDPEVSYTTGNHAGDNLDELLKIEDVSGQSGETVTIDVVADDRLRGVAFAELQVCYDPLVLQFIPTDPANPKNDFKAGPVIDNALVVVNATYADRGKIVIGLVGTHDNDRGGILVSFPMTIAANAPDTTSDLRLTADLDGANGNAGRSGVIDGAVVIRRSVGLPAGGTGSSEPSTQPAKGDANGDGKIDVADVRAAIGLLLGTTPATRDAIDRVDLNGDGILNLSDIRILLQLTLTNG